MTDTPETQGDLVRQRREALDLDQSALGSLAGVSPNTVKYVERGWIHDPDELYIPQRKSLIKLSEVLGIPLDEMLTAYGYDTGARDKAQFTVTGLTPTQVEMVRAYIDELRAQNLSTE